MIILLHMDHYTVVTSLKRLDKKFTEELSEAGRRAALAKFKHLYAEEMAKLATQLTKRQKLQSNLTQVSQQELSKARQIEQDIKRRMEKSAQNREKHQQTVEKEIRMGEDNWKKKMDEINRKKKEEFKHAFRKAEQIRKEAQQFWLNKKASTARDSRHKDSSHSNKQETSPTKQEENYSNLHSNPYLKAHQPIRDFSKQQNFLQNKTFNTIRTEEKKLRLHLPDLNKTKINAKINKTSVINDSLSERTKNEEIRVHISRTEHARKAEAEANLQKIMLKLEKIQKTRQAAQERMEQEVKEAKRLRELRESPEVHAANRQRSIEQLHSKSRSRLQRSSKGKEDLGRSLSKSRLAESMQKHLQTKQRILEEEFNERESLHQRKQQKLKQGKLNRLIKQAINQLKQKTLNEKN